jgi:hypothetical protein
VVEGEGFVVSRLWKLIGLGVLVAVQLPGLAVAQTPVTPGAPEQPPAGQARFCDSMLGKIFNGVLTPANSVNAGVIPPPSAIDLAGLQAPPESVDGATARIKKDEADARARCANVRYLGTVDWLRYPEAEKALILALRTDHNEGVRSEAALALGNGPFCSKEVIEALSLTVDGSDKDGNPPERSAHVRHLASVTLNHCKERTNQAAAGTFEQAAQKEIPVKYQVVGPKQLQVATTITPTRESCGAVDQGVPTGKRGLFDMFARAFGQGGPVPPPNTGK